MPYYDTLDEDLERAKLILEKGKAEDLHIDLLDGRTATAPGGTIFGADIYAAYKLLESFVAEIEQLQTELALLKASRRAFPTKDQLLELRRAVADGAGHECEEWFEGGRCLLCDSGWRGGVKP